MNLEFDDNAFEDLRYWIEVDLKKAKKIMTLIEEVKRSPFKGTGKPEPLKHKLERSWSRRIDQEHRLEPVFTVSQICPILKRGN